MIAMFRAAGTDGLIAGLSVMAELDFSQLTVIGDHRISCIGEGG